MQTIITLKLLAIRDREPPVLSHSCRDVIRARIRLETFSSALVLLHVSASVQQRVGRCL
jgi:hypothetical protein